MSDSYSKLWLKIDSTSIPGPFLKLGEGKGPGVGWSRDTHDI